MNPVKPNDIYDIMASRSSYDRELIEQVVSHHYHYVRSQLTSLAYPLISIPGFGTFELRIDRVEEKISKLKTDISMLQVRSDSYAKNLLTHKLLDLSKLEKAYSEIMKEHRRKDIHRKKRSKISEENK